MIQVHKKAQQKPIAPNNVMLKYLLESFSS